MSACKKLMIEICSTYPVIKETGLKLFIFPNLLSRYQSLELSQFFWIFNTLLHWMTEKNILQFFLLWKQIAMNNKCFNITWKIGMNWLRQNAETQYPQVDVKTPKSILKYCCILFPEYKCISGDSNGIHIKHNLNGKWIFKQILANT